MMLWNFQRLEGERGMMGVFEVSRCVKSHKRICEISQVLVKTAAIEWDEREVTIRGRICGFSGVSESSTFSSANSAWKRSFPTNAPRPCHRKLSIQLIAARG